MTDYPKCPECGGENTYFDGTTYVCPDCGLEFDEATARASEEAGICRDSNGTPLADGDSVTVIKDLKVRGSSLVIKQGTKVKGIRLTDNPEEVDGKVDGSMMVLKACFLRKG